MAFKIILFLAGMVIVTMTLRDIFETVVVPGGSRASLKVAKRLVWALLPLWKAGRGKFRGLSSAFAPLVLVLSFVIWISLLAAGFGLMAFAMRTHFQPPLKSIPDSIYMVGSSIITVGVSEENALGAARWLILAAGFCGLGAMTMAVTYLLQVQSSIARRDIGIIKLNTSAGDPPSALTLLLRFASIDHVEELGAILREGRSWCAAVRQSHGNHPSLIYFQSVSAGSGWPAALAALLDLALIVERMFEDHSLSGAAMLLRQEGTHMARELAHVARVKPAGSGCSEAELRQVAAQLREAGYALVDDLNFSVIADQQAVYRSCVDALAEHLGKPTAPLVRQS